MHTIGRGNQSFGEHRQNYEFDRRNPSIQVRGHVGVRRSRCCLRQEPFVSGADAIIDRMVHNIRNAANGFTLILSSQPFPGYQVEFDWRRAEFEGNWYFSDQLNMEGWLCPALFKYFSSVPPKIYVEFRPKTLAVP